MMDGFMESGGKRTPDIAVRSSFGIQNVGKGNLAQLVERQSEELRVTGSNPVVAIENGRVAGKGQFVACRVSGLGSDHHSLVMDI